MCDHITIITNLMINQIRTCSYTCQIFCWSVGSQPILAHHLLGLIGSRFVRQNNYIEQFVCLDYISISWFILSGKYICVLTRLLYVFGIRNNVPRMLFFLIQDVEFYFYPGCCLSSGSHPGRNGITCISPPDICFLLTSLGVHPEGRFCFYPGCDIVWLWFIGSELYLNGVCSGQNPVQNRWFDWNIICCDNISEFIFNV